MNRPTFRYFLGAVLFSVTAVATPLSYSDHPSPCAVTYPVVKTVKQSKYYIHPCDVEDRVQPSIAPIYPGDIDPSSDDDSSSNDSDSD